MIKIIHFSFKRDNNAPATAVPAIESPSNDDQRPKSLVEQLKSTMRKTPRSNSIDTSESIDACARNASKKLFSQLKTMDKDNVKELINNPKQPHKMAVMNIQAREKLREGMRKQLKTLGAEDQDDVMFDVEESVNCENIPETLIAQISRTVNTDLGVEDMDLQQDGEVDDMTILDDDKDMEVVEKNLGNDFLFGSEMLLMNGFSLLGENETEGGEADIKIPDDNRFLPPPALPPLPIEPTMPKPPEPVPSPSVLKSNSSDSTDAVFSSSNKPWTVVAPKPIPPRLNKEFEKSSRNPDPPGFNDSSKIEIQPIQVIVSQPVTQTKVPTVEGAINNANIIEVVASENPLLNAVKNLPPPSSTNTNLIPLKSASIDEKQQLGGATPGNQNNSSKISAAATPNVNNLKTVLNDDDWDNPVAATPAPAEQQNEATPVVNESEQRANETYGDYRRRLKGMENNKRDDRRKDFDDEDRMSKVSENSWTSRNNNNNNNNNNERKSRFEGIRGGRKNNNNNNDRRHYDNNNSRDRNRDRWRDDRGREEDMKDAFNYRFNASADADPDRLTNILNPKPVNFRGSFKKRGGHSRDFNRSPSRERTPLNNSMEREFGETVVSSASDIRPCYHTMKKILEIDNNLSKTFEKIHGIDKVISNLQIERVNHQKTVTRLMHDRKVLFDNVIRRSMANENNANNESVEQEVREPKEKKRQRLIDDDDDRPTATTIHISPMKPSSKKIVDLTEQKKRKNEESSAASSKEDESSKKKRFVIEEEPKTPQQRQREQEEKERLRRIEEIRKIKQQRKEREAAAQRQLEEQAIRESNDFIPIIKTESRDKSSDKAHKTKTIQPSSSVKVEKDSKKEKSVANDERVLIKLSDVINPADHKIKKMELKLPGVKLSQSALEQFKIKHFVEITLEDWNKWSQPIAKVEKPTEKPVEKPEQEQEKEKESEVMPVVEMEEEKEKSPPKEEVKLIEKVEKDPLAIDDFEIEHPPTTPGSHLTMDDEEVSIASISNDDDQDYSEWAGNFSAHVNPIVYLQNIDGKFMVCAAECGKLYKYRLKTGKCEAIFSMHTEICNSFVYNDQEHSIFTASSDGTSYRLKIKVIFV